MRKLKSNIGWIIERSKYNREYIRKRYGKSRNTVSNWCTGKSHPKAEEMWDLAELLDVKVDDMYEFMPEDDND